MNRLVVILFLISVCSAGRISKCREDIDDCYEQRIHPDFQFANDLSYVDAKERTSSFWLENGKKFVEEQAKRKQNKNVAKNVIFFLGDGMGLATIAAARAYLGGEEKKLSFENFPFTGLSKTYSVDKIVPDSACTATAYLCGVKGNYATIGVDARVPRSDCHAAVNETHVFSIAKWTQDAGKSTGLVTTTRVTHASPAGLYAHIADRDWENDSEVKKTCDSNAKIADIAYQLMHGETGKEFKVILGGGRGEFVSKDFDQNGLRSDGLDLISDWKRESSLKSEFVENREQLLNSDAERLLGLFQYDHMKYHLESPDGGDQPTLAEMTQKAIEVLQKDDNGYFLFVEGGKIDLAHHDTYARLALDETAEFSKAIELARNLTSLDDTLIVVTADHSHTLSYAGYGARHNDIFGTAGKSDEDNLPYLTLTYANGKGFDQYFDTNTNTRNNPETVDRSDKYATYPATVPIVSETHGGEDVAVYASGPWAHLFTGVYEQNTIPHLMAYASCVGKGLKACDLS